MNNIEAFVNQLQGNRHNNKVSVVLYDPMWNCHHLLCKINRKTNTCEMITVPASLDEEVEVSIPFISQLNLYYNHCTIDETSKWIGLTSKEIIRSYSS